jgi:hypothetical protein
MRCQSTSSLCVPSLSSRESTAAWRWRNAVRRYSRSGAKSLSHRSALNTKQAPSAQTNRNAATIDCTRGTGSQSTGEGTFGGRPPVSNVFHSCPQMQNHLSFLRGDQPQSGQRMREPEESRGLSRPGSRSMTGGAGYMFPYYELARSLLLISYRSPRMKLRTSSAKSSGSSATAKCPPRGISVQRFTL